MVSGYLLCTYISEYNLCFIYPQAVGLIYFIVTILLVTTSVQGRSGGAPLDACGDIIPMHVGSPSNTALPYSVDLSDFTDGEYIPGETYESKK